MKNKSQSQHFQDFLNTPSVRVPDHTTARVLSYISDLMNPHPLKVFFNFAVLQFFAGALTFFICHQFGLNPFNTSYSVADWLMETWGHSACMIGCGFIFVGAGVLASQFWLTVEERMVLRKNGILQSACVGILSLGIFYLFGADIALTTAGLWLLGAVLSAFVFTSIFRGNANFLTRFQN